MERRTSNCVVCSCEPWCMNRSTELIYQYVRRNVTLDRGHQVLIFGILGQHESHCSGTQWLFIFSAYLSWFQTHLISFFCSDFILLLFYIIIRKLMFKRMYERYRLRVLAYFRRRTIPSYHIHRWFIHKCDIHLNYTERHNLLKMSKTRLRNFKKLEEKIVRYQWFDLLKKWFPAYVKHAEREDYRFIKSYHSYEKNEEDKLDSMRKKLLESVHHQNYSPLG